jgi:hypothetical protein
MMKMTKVVAGVALAMGSFATPACATSIDWTYWNPGQISGDIAKGKIRHDRVKFDGSLDNVLYNWYGASAFLGKKINAPTGTDGVLLLQSDDRKMETINFSHPIKDPVLAIWNLGSAEFRSYLDFHGHVKIEELDGGRKIGESIHLSKQASDIYGNDASGVVEFLGTFSSLSWFDANPNGEYKISVGRVNTSPVPEPGTFVVMAAGLCGLGFSRLRRKVGKLVAGALLAMGVFAAPASAATIDRINWESAIATDSGAIPGPAALALLGAALVAVAGAMRRRHDRADDGEMILVGHREH